MPAASRLLINLRSTLNRIIALQCELMSARLICDGKVYFTHVKIVGDLIVKKLVLRNVSCLPAKLCLPPRHLVCFVVEPPQSPPLHRPVSPSSTRSLHSISHLTSAVTPPLHLLAGPPFTQLLGASCPSFLSSKSGVNTSSILHRR
jgi:hypothetical protein